MKKSGKSLVNHVLTNNFSIIITAVIVVFISLLVSFCGFYRYTMISEAKTQHNETVSSFKFLIDKRIQQSDYIIRDSRMIEGLNSYYEDNYELVDFTMDFAAFVNSLSDKEIQRTNTFAIYTKNPTLVNSGYIVRADRLENFDILVNECLENMRFFCWGESIKIDEDTRREYLTLYRYVDMEYDFIIEMKIFTDDAIPQENIFGTRVKKGKTADSNPLIFTSELSGGFEVVSQVSRKELVKHYLRYFLVLLGICLAFIIITYLLASRSVNRTMSDILRLIDGIESGDIDKGGYAGIDQWNEVNIIKDKISELTYKLSDITAREYKQELFRRKLEIEVLNSKINPHLLYNSLSAIKLVAFKEKNNKVSDMADVLIEYYRLVLNKGEDTISVVRELEYLEKYIEIHEISKKINYDVEYDVCKEAFDTKIPHMLLQPVVENAILHGLNTSTDARIKICVKMHGDYLNIDITDNGVGIEADKLAKLNTAEGMGYGLRSVVQRAEYYYDGNFEFNIHSVPDEGTTVSLRIPREIRTTI